MAREFARRALGLNTPWVRIDEALDHLGFIQIDPLNVCGRMHDHILRNRIADYREGGLMRHLHGGEGVAERKPAAARRAFEHHLPDTNVLVAFPLEAWPHLPAAMRARTKRASAWSGWLTPRERKIAPALLAEISRQGPMGSEDFADTRRAHRSVWGAASLVKSTLQKLFFHGELLIAERTSHRRRYDLPERVIPARILGAPEATRAETARWLARLKLRQRRLAVLKRDELNAIADEVAPVVIEPPPGRVPCPKLHLLRSDLPLLEAVRDEADSHAEEPRPPLLLAPLDPLIYDRRVTAALWDFEYTWEVYTPPAKRQRGYYALPILVGTEIVGHVDPKADRPAGKLRIVKRSVRRGHRVAPAVEALAQFLGLKA